MLRRRALLRLIAVAALLVSGTCLARAWHLGGVTPQSDRARSPILVLVSFDGWRWDYIDRFRTPNLRALAARGARAERLIPSFPPLTFPNHYTLVTGLYPEHHGIVANVMRDPAIPERFTKASQTAKDPVWWRREPIWVTAIRQGRRSAAMFWPGTEAAIDGVRPTFWMPYDEGLPTSARVEQTLAWLALPDAERPAFVCVYFEEADSAAHDFGLDSPQLTAATEHLDAALGQLVAGIARIGIADRTTLVVVSDHGMVPLSPSRVVLLDDYVDPERLEIFESGGFLAAAPANGDVEAVYARLHGRHPALTVYRRNEVPARLHYRDSRRIAPIIGVPTEGWAVTTRAALARKPLQAAAHGYDPNDRSMGALFVAAGPDIAAGIVIQPFENVNVYNFLCSVLGLTPAKNDGSDQLEQRLRRR